jgi:hypothetical protein
LNDEDAVGNLQDAYGYYVDRRMWPDVVDLFVSNTTSTSTSTSTPRVQISDVGAFTGSTGVLAAMQLMGPENLTQGILNEHLNLDTIVSIHPNGLSATTRGIEIGMIGDANTHAASWEFIVFSNGFVKDGDGDGDGDGDEDGVWKFGEVNITRLVVANYSTGWGNGSTVSLPIEVPAFLDVSGRSSRFMDVTGRHANTSVRVADLQLKLGKSAAYDGVENVASAYGYYADDLQSDQLGAVHAVNGHKEVPFTGFYYSSDRIAAACHNEYGYPNMSTLRSGISFHWLMQPVILVADDGRSASLRARLLQPSTSQKDAGTFEGGMYANGFALEEPGVWKI